MIAMVEGDGAVSFSGAANPGFRYGTVVECRPVSTLRQVTEYEHERE
jgi:hypothetical protein